MILAQNWPKQQNPHDTAPLIISLCLCYIVVQGTSVTVPCSMWPDCLKEDYVNPITINFNFDL